jgi:hypothetical protein
VDGVRALAAVFVVLHHMWLKTYPAYPRNGGPAVGAIFGYGHVAVAVFIVVSGFSLSIAPARRDWQLSGGFRTFLRRRAWRILPTYWAALALSCFIFAVITPNLTGDGITTKAVGVHAVLLQDLVSSLSQTVRSGRSPSNGIYFRSRCSSCFDGGSDPHCSSRLPARGRRLRVGDPDGDVHQDQSDATVAVLFIAGDGAASMINGEVRADAPSSCRGWPQARAAPPLSRSA